MVTNNFISVITNYHPHNIIGSVMSASGVEPLTISHTDLITTLNNMEKMDQEIPADMWPDWLITTAWALDVSCLDPKH